APPARAPTRVVARGGPARGRGEAAEPWHHRRHLGTEAMSPSDHAAEDGITRAVQPGSRPAWYALERGGWRDYVTLLHPPYTAWHLSYVAIGATLTAEFSWSRFVPTLVAFFLGVGIGAHALDELNGRPLRTQIPRNVLLLLAFTSIGGAAAIGIVGAVTVDPWIAAFVAAGAFIVVVY